MGGKRFGSLGWTSCLFCLAAILVSFPRYAMADDEEIRQVIRHLADKDAAVRRKAVDVLVQTRDDRFSALLKSYYEENLSLWHGQPVIAEQAPADANGKRAALLDPLTLQPLLKEGQSVVVPIGEIKEVELAANERKAVNNAVKTLALWSNDFEKRLSGIQWAGDGKHVEMLPALEEIAKADPAEKIRLFMSLFRGRDDLYAKRWENKDGAKSGYTPVCLNERKPGLCRKFNVKCAACQHRSYAPLDEEAIEAHLRGDFVAGVYPLLQDETCHFLAIDFDKDGWQQDVSTLRDVCSPC